MKRRGWLLGLCLVACLVGCTQTVTYYEGRRVPDREVATLEHSYLARILIDQKILEPELGAFTHHVQVKLLPGEYVVEWHEGSGDYNFMHRGYGTLKAQAGHRYILCSDYLPGATRLAGTGVDQKYLETQVLGIASWIEDKDSGRVVVGTRPAWADTQKRPQVIYH